jgi:hypothetical protein
MSYATEQDLFDVAINSPFIEKFYDRDVSCMLIEPKGLFGIPDLLIANQEKEKDGENCITVIAFEMKLRNWKRALCQAFRYRAFSNISYVVLDHAHTNSALKNIDKFQKSNIGLVSIDAEGVVHSHFEPFVDEPYCDNYENQIWALAGTSQ